jgi:hypothetical protein
LPGARFGVVGIRGCPMSLRQSAGMMVTILVVAGLDLRLDLLIPLAMVSGGLATYLVSIWEETRR